MLRLILLFTLVPLCELALLLWLSSVTDWKWTLLLVIVTGIVGASLARHQGFRTWQRIQQQMARGEPPAGSLVDALLILIAGALLLTPGILTDVVGFGLLIPPVRSILKKRLAERFRSKIVMQFPGASGFPGGNHHDDENIIDVEPIHRDNDSPE